MKKAEQMLYNLETEIATLKIQEKIIAQKEVIAEAEKAEKDLQKEQENMVKQIEKLQKEILDTQAAIEKNKQSQEDQAKLIEAENVKLAALVQELEAIIK
jgi:hypothetical protein